MIYISIANIKYIYLLLNINNILLYRDQVVGDQVISDVSSYCNWSLLIYLPNYTLLNLIGRI